MRPNQATGQSSYHKLQNALDNFQIWNGLSQSEIGRIAVVEGDLKKLKFGLTDERYYQLSDNIGKAKL